MMQRAKHLGMQSLKITTRDMNMIPLTNRRKLDHTNQLLEGHNNSLIVTGENDDDSYNDVDDESKVDIVLFISPILPSCPFSIPVKYTLSA